MTPGYTPLELRPMRRVPLHERPEDERRQVMPEDLAKFQPVRRYLSDTTSVIRAGGAVDHTHRWTWADRTKEAL